MTRRTLAGLIALPLVLGLLLTAWLVPLPFATYQPGPTVDVLGEVDGEEAIQIEGRPVYRDDGQLRLTTVSVSRAQRNIGLLELMSAWASPDRAVYPYESVHPEGSTPELDRQEGAVDMVTSQDKAIAVALNELDYKTERVIQVFFVAPDSPADGKLEVRDMLLSVNGADIKTDADVIAAVRATPPGKPVSLRIERAGKVQTVDIQPNRAKGKPEIGIQLGEGFRFPFRVSVQIDDNIGGPSAGLMFALAIYDTLTPGSMTGGQVVAGTGTIGLDGVVGPIGGIQQKIAGAKNDGATLFLVPPDNCASALAAGVDDIRLVKAETMTSATTSLEAWAADEDADLPSCEEN